MFTAQFGESGRSLHWLRPEDWRYSHIPPGVPDVTGGSQMQLNNCAIHPCLAVRHKPPSAAFTSLRQLAARWGRCMLTLLSCMGVPGLCQGWECGDPPQERQRQGRMGLMSCYGERMPVVHSVFPSIRAQSVSLLSQGPGHCTAVALGRACRMLPSAASTKFLDKAASLQLQGHSCPCRLSGKQSPTSAEEWVQLGIGHWLPRGRKGEILWALPRTTAV